MPEITFKGTRTDGRCAVTIHGSGEVRDLQPFRKGDGFEWGYAGGGPSALALALCIEALVLAGAERPAAVRRAQDVYQTFKRLVVASLPHDRWTLTADEVRERIFAIEGQRDEDEARGAHPTKEGTGAGAAHVCTTYRAERRSGRRGPGPCANCGRTAEEHVG